MYIASQVIPFEIGPVYCRVWFSFTIVSNIIDAGKPSVVSENVITRTYLLLYLTLLPDSI